MDYKTHADSINTCLYGKSRPAKGLDKRMAVLIESVAHLGHFERVGCRPLKILLGKTHMITNTNIMTQLRRNLWQMFVVSLWRA